MDILNDNINEIKLLNLLERIDNIPLNYMR
jgi:hypothetical protein